MISEAALMTACARWVEAGGVIVPESMAPAGVDCACPLGAAIAMDPPPSFARYPMPSDYGHGAFVEGFDHGCGSQGTAAMGRRFRAGALAGLGMTGWLA